MDKQWIEQLNIANIISITPISGGDVNESYKVDTSDEQYFLLVQRNRNSDFYAAEIAGLKQFEAAGIQAPIVIDYGQITDDAYLLLSYLDEGIEGQQSDLARLVAKMHQNKQPEGQFGFDLPYQGGDITFDNAWSKQWQDIFVKQRLDPLKDALVERGMWQTADIQQYEQVRAIINQSLAEHHSEPSLLHGDLWGGNHMFLTDGSPALFDPAPLYGDREFDIGITMVFGAFNQSFYETYQQVLPLADGAELRLEFYKLYLLMVHLLKFGGMYASSVERSMYKIIQAKA
ncbi:fructosamine kinase family protein [Staphylococcus arlettae]|uniref:fructosamine kinase family protein n=1 Tax=Staphylococcus arlettae TaxID=29378 RepID=UPI001E36EFD4|nr:fructosamine kinase family protein [Staphylococcus arlettae]MCD8849768.1 fructosamine kinase family protein [Staphylococcus arlettae]